LIAVSGLTEADAGQYASSALRHSQVAAAIDGKDYRVVEVVDYGDGKSGVVVWIYNYTDNSALAVEIDRASGRVASAHLSQSMPNFSEAERIEARQIALADPQVLARTGGRFIVVNVTSSDRGECAGRRCLAVFMTPIDRDYDKLIVAIVDLSTKRVRAFAL
jgi:hypothetical protein